MVLICGMFRALFFFSVVFISNFSTDRFLILSVDVIFSGGYLNRFIFSVVPSDEEWLDQRDTPG